MNMNQKYCNGIVHVIKKGENLYQLSRMYRVPLALILRANPYLDVYNLQPGQEICVPVCRRKPMPGMKPPRRENMPAASAEENGSAGDGMAEVHQEEVPRMEEMPREETPREKMEAPDVPAAGNRPEEEDEKETYQSEYVADGTTSLGEILRRAEIDLNDLAQCNDLDHIIVAADVTISLPKKI